MVNWFGPQSWGAPICRDAPRCDVPIGDTCLRCARAFADTDSGVTMPLIGVDAVTIAAYHLECFLKLIGVPPQRMH